ncbi:MAG: glycosyltransferase family 2 protein [Lachnospiraceae bacterium]|nr:glycosyltransferase family 2 protein [Lachnospiraceae bacterium]
MISIIVPIYNVAPYLSQCIESLMEQTYKDIEMILVDDGSTDNSLAICEEYKKKDPRIRVIHQENKGVVSTRKEGLKAARGTYIGFVDGDDWIEPDMYACMYQKLTEQKVDVVMCGRYEDTGASRRMVFHGVGEGRYGKQGLTEEVYPKMIIGGDLFTWGIFPGLWDKLFCRHCLEYFQFAVDERITMGEDAACVYPCLLHADSIYVMDKCFYHYRQSAVSMVKKRDRAEIERERFQLLYRSVDQRFKADAHIFDLRPQWKEYMLFLMVPRADTLLKGIETLDYLFPFPQVKRGSDIILYGMGTYGQRLYRYIKRTGFCHIVMAADRGYVELQKQGIPVCAPEDIMGCRCDAVVVASSFARARHEIYKELTEKFPPEKVHLMDEELIKSREIMERFGLV